jgi:Dullard-like phosphatase family protein
MFFLPNDRAGIEYSFKTVRESPPTIRYVKAAAPHFSLSDVLRTLRWECTEYYTPPPAIEDKKTLVLDLDETLIHSSTFPPHSKIEAFRVSDIDFYVFKRPGLDDFLNYARENFEVFVFTHGEERYAKPILDKLMPWVDEEHRLYREACNGRRGPRKNLDLFGRSKKRLVLVDDSESALSANPENTVQIPKWCGSPSDRVLIDWLPKVLEECLEAEDVREVITKIAISRKERDTCDGLPIIL